MSHYMFLRARQFRVLVALMAMACLTSQAKRMDVVIMKNGDRLTGEVKKMENGLLYVETDYVSGSVGLDWRQVKSVQTNADFQVALRDGSRVAGTISKVASEESPGEDFSVQTTSGGESFSGSDVVTVESQKGSFWRQIKGSIDFGFAFDSGNGQTQLNSDASAGYTATSWAVGLDLTSSLSGQSATSKTNVLELQLLGTRFLSRDAFLLGLGDFLHSSQQEVDLRTTLGGGYGRYWIHSTQTFLRWVTGSVYTHERFQPAASQTSQQNVEALFGLQGQLFNFNRYELQSYVFVFPGLSDFGRIRATPKTTFTVKLTNNFHTDFSFWDNFDSQPPFKAKRNELGISSSLGWSF
jgi:putative salt-induced outer membrane protein YdiY